MHHLGFPFRCTFCLSHVPRKGKKHIMENASNICWHNCCLSNSPPLPLLAAVSPHFPSSHLFCNSIDRWIYHSLWSLPSRFTFNGCLLKILCNVCKGKPQEDEYETILRRHFSGRIYKKYGSMFRREFRFILYFLCQYNSISVLTLFVFVFSANYARSWTWPCNCCSLSYQFSRVSCFFFRFVFCFSSYIIGKWQCQKLVAFPICHSLLPVASCFAPLMQRWQFWKTASF